MTEERTAVKRASKSSFQPRTDTLAADLAGFLFQMLYADPKPKPYSY